MVNSNNVITSGKGKNDNFSQNVYFNRNFKKRGRNLSLSSDFSIVDNVNNHFTDGLYSFYEGGTPDDSLVNQLKYTGGEN